MLSNPRSLHLVCLGAEIKRLTDETGFHHQLAAAPGTYRQSLLKVAKHRHTEGTVRRNVLMTRALSRHLARICEQQAEERQMLGGVFFARLGDCVCQSEQQAVGPVRVSFGPKP
ncbi:hypothetical protein Thi970DRAFT_05002 [Thiorhodovibrio frisius]|uniref:Uncharacterized protein n=1 Tax=Thiorhodovibrio frisius TaxID=631362 RepID=H8Z8S2_9GAMM|nr:hypothetical protein Thi970DRAFT_05002 [Thiorhodovibrio frisius]WPL22216.1 hypothetical protein Thiofri_02376 [Thiorhodovibrio frisius]